MKNMHKKVLWITRTAIFIALLVVLQAVTMNFGNTIITGAVNNLMFIISVMTSGPATGITVALISPFIAKLFGIGPFWSLIPFIAIGNIVLVLIWYFIGNRNLRHKIISYVIALVVAALAKASILYIGIVRIAIPFLLDIPEQQAAVLSNMFSISQFITASIGGVCATIILSTLKKALNREL